ncbi:MAG: Uncharacterised protein [Pseudidiomarina mangrovi]|nr:MAG: Uncharacterised protein [Pseudidiomarina mangrovi]
MQRPALLALLVTLLGLLQRLLGVDLHVRIELRIILLNTRQIMLGSGYRGQFIARNGSGNVACG